MNYGALLKRLAGHVEVFKKFAAEPPEKRRVSKAVWNEWARDFEVALSMFAAHDGCTCNVIMAADPTRHFRGCPLREKYPDHPAAHEVDGLKWPDGEPAKISVEAKRRGPTLEHGTPMETEPCGEEATWDFPMYVGMGTHTKCVRPKGHEGMHEAKSGASWRGIETVKKAARSPWTDFDGPREQALIEAWAIIANVSNGNWEVQSKNWQNLAAEWRDRWLGPQVKKEPRCGIAGCTLHPGHPGDHGSYILQNGRDMGPVLRPETYEKGVSPGCPVHGVGMRIGPAIGGLAGGLRWTTEAECTCKPLPPPGPTVFEHDLEIHRKRIHAIMSSRAESADNWVSDALWFLLAVTHAPGEPQLEERVEKLENTYGVESFRALMARVDALEAGRYGAIKNLDTAVFGLETGLIKRVEKLEDLPRRVIQGELTDPDLHKRIETLEKARGVQAETLALGAQNRLALENRLTMLEKEVADIPIRRGPMTSAEIRKVLGHDGLWPGKTLEQEGEKARDICQQCAHFREEHYDGRCWRALYDRSACPCEGFIERTAVRPSGLRPEQAAAVLHYDCPTHGLHLLVCCEAARRREPPTRVPEGNVGPVDPDIIKKTSQHTAPQKEEVPQDLIDRAMKLLTALEDDPRRVNQIKGRLSAADVERVAEEFAAVRQEMAVGEKVPEELSNASLLQRAVDLLDGICSDAGGSITYSGGPDVGKTEPTQEAEALAAHFVAVRDRAWMTKIRREIPFQHDDERDEIAAVQCVRVLFKGWNIEKQRVYLQGLVEEHAYSLGLQCIGMNLPKAADRKIQDAWAEGNNHRIEEEKK